MRGWRAAREADGGPPRARGAQLRKKNLRKKLDASDIAALEAEAAAAGAGDHGSRAAAGSRADADAAQIAAEAARKEERCGPAPTLASWPACSCFVACLRRCAGRAPSARAVASATADAAAHLGCGHWSATDEQMRASGTFHKG